MLCVWVSDGKTLHGIGQFIIANVISCFVLLPLPTQHRRLLPDREKYNTTTWRSRFSHLSLYLLFLFLFCCSSFQQRRGKCLQPVSSLYYDFPLFLKIEEALWRWLSYYSALDQLNLSFWTPSANFCHSGRQMCISSSFPPLPVPTGSLKLSSFRLWSAACRMEIFCMVNLPSCPQRIHYTSLKNASESFWKGPFFSLHNQFLYVLNFGSHEPCNL